MTTAQELYEAIREERRILSGWAPMPAWEATSPEQQATWELFAVITNKTNAKQR